MIAADDSALEGWRRGVSAFRVSGACVRYDEKRGLAIALERTVQARNSREALRMLAWYLWDDRALAEFEERPLLARQFFHALRILREVHENFGEGRR